MPHPLAGQTVLITGASAGLGHAAALAFAAAGANLVLTARRAERLEALCTQIGSQAVFHAGDAALEPTAQAAVALALSTFGRLDILINNAGIGNYKKLVDTSAADYDEMMLANVRSSFLFARHAAPPMIAAGRGQILFVSSIAGLQGYAGEAVYCASKIRPGRLLASPRRRAPPPRHQGRRLLPRWHQDPSSPSAKGRTPESIAASNMMDPAEVAEALLYTCSTPHPAK